MWRGRNRTACSLPTNRQTAPCRGHAFTHLAKQVKTHKGSTSLATVRLSLLAYHSTPVTEETQPSPLLIHYISDLPRRLTYCLTDTDLLTFPQAGAPGSLPYYTAVYPQIIQPYSLGFLCRTPTRSYLAPFPVGGVWRRAGKPRLYRRALFLYEVKSSLALILVNAQSISAPSYLRTALTLQIQ